MAEEDKVVVAKSDLEAAWMVLENLAVSLDQMGGAFSHENSSNGAQLMRALQESLAAYLTPELVQAINDARIRLGRYIPDAEAEALAEQIAYWDYSKRPRVTSESG